MEREFTAGEVARLAALSRTYHDSKAEIVAALVQELDRDLDPEWRADVARRFGLTEEEAARYNADNVRALYHGYIHRAGLVSADAVYVQVLQQIAEGDLKSGDQLPPRTKFTAKYHCAKKVHGVVVERLLRSGVVHRPGGDGGPLFIV